MPLFHVNCRCTTVPYIPEAQGSYTPTRAARDPETGKTIRVKKQSLEEWKKDNQKIIDNETHSVIIKSSYDIVIGKSVGAAAHLDKVDLPDGTIGRLSQGTKITKVVTFAGKGTKKPIRDAVYLERKYGVIQSEWKKVRGDGYVDVNGVSKHAELHWYEADNFGRVKMKVKRWFP